MTVPSCFSLAGTHIRGTAAASPAGHNRSGGTARACGAFGAAAPPLARQPPRGERRRGEGDRPRRGGDRIARRRNAGGVLPAQPAEAGERVVLNAREAGDRRTPVRLVHVQRGALAQLVAAGGRGPLGGKFSTAICPTGQAMAYTLPPTHTSPLPNQRRPRCDAVRAAADTTRRTTARTLRTKRPVTHRNGRRRERRLTRLSSRGGVTADYWTTATPVARSAVPQMLPVSLPKS